MAGGVEIGIGLALAAAILTNFASLLKHRGCQHTERISIGRPLRSARALASSPWFAAGWAVAAIAWLVHVAALSLAPISLVQAVLAGGAVSLAVMAQRLFGHPVTARQWLGLAVGASGLALLVVTVPHFSGSHSGFSVPAILGFEGGLVLLAAGLAASHRSERFGPHGGVLLSVIAGILFASAGVAIKGLTGAAPSAAILVPWVGLIVLAGGVAQYAAAAALQRGDAVETIGLMGLVANAVQITGGVLIFGDPLSPTPLGLALQATAFAMVCLSALLIPGRVTHRRPALLRAPAGAA